MSEQQTTLERAVLDTSPHDLHDLAGMMEADDFAAVAEAVADEAEAVPDLISVDVWAQQWGLLHDVLGGMVMARTGQACPLGNQARSEGGMIACNAAYELIAMSPARDMVLGAHSTFAGQLLAVGMHGFACVQIVKGSRAAADQATINGSFSTVRDKAA